ncbi:IS30 family transposase [Weissella diestrammenae]|uniref:IS30 family transposase n=1 Tax=Weissella diestrammenae TaxID=1162633 RepID=A0A7G9T5M3_9LACO|nr:IS30 family transposase [Weissella diestrammenae]QNN75398.1 IS30 family transposase [Weissella diestrammenae]
MGRKFIHLTYAERVQIQILRKQGLSYLKIAKEIGRAKSTIVDEVHRNTRRPNIKNHTRVFDYEADFAQFTAQTRLHETTRRELLLTNRRQRKINELLDKQWSLEQIAMGTTLPMSTATLYAYAHRGLIPYRTKKYRTKPKPFRSNVPDKQFFIEHHISHRSRRIEERLDFGRWEVDGVEGPKDSKALVLTFVERKTRYTVALKAKDKTADAINNVMQLSYQGILCRCLFTLAERYKRRTQ